MIGVAVKIKVDAISSVCHPKTITHYVDNNRCIATAYLVLKRAASGGLRKTAVDEGTWIITAGSSVGVINLARGAERRKGGWRWRNQNTGRIFTEGVAQERSRDKARIALRRRWLRGRACYCITAAKSLNLVDWAGWVRRIGAVGLAKRTFV